MSAEPVPASMPHTCPAHGLYFGDTCTACPDGPTPSLEPARLEAAPDADGGTGSPAEPTRAGRYDDAARRTAQRTGREKGCWVYIPRDELLKAGIDPDGTAPFYRVWGRERGSVLVRLYGEA